MRHLRRCSSFVSIALALLLAAPAAHARRDGGALSPRESKSLGAKPPTRKPAQSPPPRSATRTNAVAPPPARPPQRPPETEQQRAFRSAMEQLLAETNRERQSRGLRPLQMDEQLCRVAVRHAEDMLRRGYMEHVTPEGLEPADRVRRDAPEALLFSVRENLWMVRSTYSNAFDSMPRDAVRGWMESPGHRVNLLNNESTHIGFGIAVAQRGRERTIHVVQLFAIAGGSWDPPPDARIWSGRRIPARPRGLLDFILFDLTDPRRRYPVEGNPDRVGVGNVHVPLQRSELVIPPIPFGEFEMGVRAAEQDGYSILRKFRSY